MAKISVWAFGMLFGLILAIGFVWFYAADELVANSDYRSINTPAPR